MGSNRNRHFDKGIPEWGKARKEIARDQKHSLNDQSIDDQMSPKTTHGGKKRKKDTKRWCRGKIDVEHTWELEKEYPGLRFAFSMWRCTRCQKKDYRIKT